MACVNIKSPQYKELVKGLDRKQKFLVSALISKYMTDNGDKLPDFVELKAMLSDVYNKTGGVDYKQFYGEVRKLFRQLIPSMTDKDIEDRVKFVDKLELMRLRSGREVLTSFINDTVYIAKSLPEDRGTKAYTDIRHEIFHVIFNNFLNNKEQISMIETFKRWKPEHASLMDKEAIEEAMADAFEEYRSKPRSIPVMIREFFERLLKFFGLISDNYNDIQRLFDDVENGKFTRNYIKDSLVTRDKSIFSNKKFLTNPDLLLQAKAYVQNTLNEYMYPGDLKDLSEQHNSSVFVTQTYDTLFQNNKEAFKLGLTKQEALTYLQVRITGILQDRTAEPQLRRIAEALYDNGKWNDLKDLFNYLQPYSEAEVTREGELRLKHSVEDDPTEALLEEDENINSLEIGSKELINPHTKISEVVKDFLSSITYVGGDGNRVGIDPGTGFVALLKMLGGIYGNKSVEDNLQSLNENYQDTAKGVQTRAVHTKLVELHNSVINYNRIVLNVRGVEGIQEIKDNLTSFGIRFEHRRDTMTVILPDNMKIENEGTNNVDNEVVFTLNRFSQGGTSYRIVQGIREDGTRFAEGNANFIQRISNETGLPLFVVNRLFTYNEHRNQIAELTKVAGSLRKLTPKFVRVTTSREIDEETGRTAMVTSYTFIDKVSEYRAAMPLAAAVRDRLDILDIRRDVVRLVDRYKGLTGKDTRAQARRILREILVDKLAVLIDSDFDRISDVGDLPRLLNSLNTLITSVPELRSETPIDEFEKTDLFLRNSSNFSNLLTNYTYEKNSPTSFATSTSNKQKWENVMKNTGYMIMKNLADFANNPSLMRDRLLPFLRNSANNYLRFNPIFNHDLNTGEFTINGDMMKYREDDFIADHQEIFFENKSAYYQKPSVPFSKETPRDWINRNFLVFFQNVILENPSRTGLHYFQQKFQPESAPNVGTIKMGVANAEQIKHGIMSMILQEGYMQHLYSTSERGNLNKNTKKSLLPGLEGSSYFMAGGQNVFFDIDGNLREGFGERIGGRIVINTANPTLNNLYDRVIRDLDGSIEGLVDMAITEKATLDGADLANLYNKIRTSYLEGYTLTDSELATLRGIGIDPKTDVEELMSSPEFANQKLVLKKVMSAYFLNSFVNGFFMNQLSSGATQNYKNPLDEIKRQAGVNAMNDTGLIDNKHGMQQQYRNVVIAGANNFYGASHRFAKNPILRRFFRNKKQEVGDAQTWDLPEYKKLLRKSFGKSVDIGVITKDVHFEVNAEGGTEYRKTSSAELTNELVQKNKTLRDLRFELTFGDYLRSLSDAQRPETEARIQYLYDKMIDGGTVANKFDGLKADINEYMEYQNLIKTVMNGNFMIHKASFDSAIKGSKPKNSSSFVKNPETGTWNFVYEPTSVLSLNSSYTGIQQAIRHKYIDSFISHFTQLTYLIGLNRTETSIKNNKIITRSLSKFTKAGIFDLLFDYRMAYDTDKLLNANLRSKKEFITDLLKKLDLPGNERLVELLKTPNISMNNPLFSEKLMQTFFNTLTKKTVTPKHPGGSFVLQSEFGFEANRILQENSMRIPEVRMDEDGNILYAECYLPEMYSDQIKSGSLIYYNSEEYGKMFGFRIPSSDLHSSVPLRVIGYYPSVSHDNVIVIPSAVTALHGSDFDVDKLFVVRYGVFGVKDENNVNPRTDLDKEEHDSIEAREYKTKFQGTNVVIAQKGIKYGFTAPDAVYNGSNSITSFGPTERHVEIFNIDGVILDEKEKTQNEILRLEIEREEFDKTPVVNERQRLAKIRDRGTRYTNKIKELQEHLSILRNIQKGLYSNQILDAVLDNIAYTGENAPDIMFGITFDPVKGYEETSEYSQLARVYSDINAAVGGEPLPARPTLFTSIEEARAINSELVEDVTSELTDNLGVDTSTPEGQEDLLSLVNEELKDAWVKERDAFMDRQKPGGAQATNINRVNHHARVHKETYMAAGLVGLIANFSKGLSYAFHGITNNANEIELNIPEAQAVEIDGERFNSLVLENNQGVKTQELRSLALNAAIDHVKEQILNVLNVGNKTAKIFLAAISTRMSLHQATMVMLQPVAKELNSSNATTVPETLASMQERIRIRLEELGQPVSDVEVDAVEVTTAKLEKFINRDFNQLLADTTSTSYREDLLLQSKVAKQLGTLEIIGNEVSKVSSILSIIQGLPFNLESAYERLNDVDDFIDIEKFFEKLSYTERSEYRTQDFKDDLRSSNNLFINVNLANNENVLGALEAIKTQIDVASEMFTENSAQMQFFVSNILRAISNNSDPSTMFTGENDRRLGYNTVASIPIKEKYLKSKNTFNMIKMISRNIFNFMTSGLNIRYNNGEHLFSMSIADQDLMSVTARDGREFQLNAVRSYVNQFLMQEGEVLVGNNYNGDIYPKSQINPEWRLKPLVLIKKQNGSNQFLNGIGVTDNFRDRVRIMTFNGNLANTAENLAAIERAVNDTNTLNNIYVRKVGDRWEDVPTSEHPHTPEMNEVLFNIIKTSLYVDKFKFSMSRVTNVIPPKYFQGVFLNLETLIKDLFYYRKNGNNRKYYKDFSDLDNTSREDSVLNDIRENLFINTIFSIPNVLPNLKSIIPRTADRYSHIFKQAGILPNGNIYDLYFDGRILAPKAEEAPEAPQAESTIDMTTEQTTSTEVGEDISEVQAEGDLFEKFRKNPSFIVDEDKRDGKKGNYEIFMKVGETGSKDAGTLKLYYKKIGIVNGKLSNSSFDLNNLFNTYSINQYFNPKRLAIPTKGVDLTQNRVTLENIPISSFIINASDDERSRNAEAESVREAFQQQFEAARALSENRSKSDEQIRSEIRTKVNVENVINKTNEVSLYDSRNMDRIGLRAYRVISSTISADRRRVTYELEALPESRQVRYVKSDSPLELVSTVRTPLSTEEKIRYINQTPGATQVSAASNLTEAEIDLEYEKARELRESEEVIKVLKDRTC
jgi:hypothetical protein